MYQRVFSGQDIVALLILVNKTGSDSKPEYFITDDPDCSHTSWRGSGLYRLSLLGQSFCVISCF